MKSMIFGAIRNFGQIERFRHILNRIAMKNIKNFNKNLFSTWQNAFEHVSMVYANPLCPKSISSFILKKCWKKGPKSHNKVIFKILSIAPLCKRWPVTPFIRVSNVIWNILVSRGILNEFWSDFGRLNTFSEHASGEVLEDCWRLRRLRTGIMLRNVKTCWKYHLQFYQTTITSFRQLSSEGSAHTITLGPVSLDKPDIP